MCILMQMSCPIDLHCVQVCYCNLKLFDILRQHRFKSFYASVQPWNTEAELTMFSCFIAQCYYMQTLMQINADMWRVSKSFSITRMIYMCVIMTSRKSTGTSRSYSERFIRDVIQNCHNNLSDYCFFSVNIPGNASHYANARWL